MLVINAAFKLTRRFVFSSSLSLSFLIQSILLGAFIGVFCTAYFVLVERPCMDPNWPRKLIARLSERSRSPEESVVCIIRNAQRGLFTAATKNSYPRNSKNVGFAS
jgi:hypothetical protein